MHIQFRMLLQGATMDRALRIAVADDEAHMRNYFQETLGVLGHEVIALAQSGRELLEHCRKLHPDLVITDIKMPDLDGLAAAAEIYRNAPIPIIVVSAYCDRELIERAAENHVLAYLIKPIKQIDLPPAIVLARRRFEEFYILRRETDNLRQALEDRKIIERAKGIIMKRTGRREVEAFGQLQKLASEKRRKLVEIAQTILTAEEALQQPD